MRASPKLHVERMEDRCVPAGFGNAWIDTNLTVSFAPDGTDVAGVPSTLFRTLGARMTAAEWQGVVRGVFQDWVAPTNLNFAVVPDDGRPVGTPGPVQGSPFVGDIRLTARPLSDNVLAITNPFDLASPWAGEVVLNSNKAFDTDGSAGTYDLRTVLYQEVGHALGVANSADPASVMYEQYGTRRLGLTAGDVAAVRTLYGVREADRFDALNSNGTVQSATAMSYLRSPADLGGTDGTLGNAPFVVLGDVTAPTDVDTYFVTPPKDQAAPTVVVETGGLSSARLDVSVWYLAAGTKSNTPILLAATSAPDAAGNYVLKLPQNVGWFTYYVRVAAADAGAFGVGSYRLAVGDGLTAVPRPPVTLNIATPSVPVSGSADWANGYGVDETRSTATILGKSRVTADQRWDYTGRATLGAAADVDTYSVVSQSDLSTLVVTVNTQAAGLNPRITVLDGKQNVLPAEVLLRNGTATIIQLHGVKKNTPYFVQVSAGDPAKWAGATPYQIGVDFRDPAISLDSFAAGTLTASQPLVAQTLDVNRTQGFRFQLSAAGTTDPATAAATLSVYDANRNVVFTLTAQNGQAVVGDVLLAPGSYTVAVTGRPADGSPLKGLRVDGRYATTTDPIGLLAPADPTTTPTAGVAPPPADLPFDWVTYDPSYYAWLL